MKRPKNPRSLKPIENKLRIDQYEPLVKKVITEAPHLNHQNTQSTDLNRLRKLSSSKQANESIRKRKFTSTSPERAKKDRQLTLFKNESRASSRIEASKKDEEQYKKPITEQTNSKPTHSQEKQTTNWHEYEELLQKQDVLRIKGLAQQLLTNMVNQKHFSMVNDMLRMKKEKMVCFLSTLFGVLTYHTRPGGLCMEDKNQHHQDSPFSNINDFFHQILKQNKCRKLKIGNSLDIKIDAQTWEKESQQLQKNLSSLIEEQKSREMMLDQVKNQYRNCCQIVNETKKQAEMFERKIYNLAEESRKLIQANEQLRTKKEEQQYLLREVEKKVEEISTFVEHQNIKPIMVGISEDFKAFEAEIYDFAYEVESRADLSSYTWEPHPYKLMESYILEDLQHIKFDIMEGDLTLEAKLQLMKEFVLQSMGKFQRKDKQMAEVLKGKTQCIKTFIEKLRKYVFNIEVKRDFLGKLVKEFALDSKKMQEHLAALAEKSQEESMMIELEGLRDCWKKIEQNYKFGNSFY